jgi:hypothetical protein
MTEYMKRRFTVAQPGAAAKQWPACGAELAYGARCVREMGHRGPCEAPQPTQEPSDD